MIKIPVARLSGRSFDFIGVRSTANDALMHGIYLDSNFQEKYMRVTIEQAEEIMKQIFDEYREQRRIRDEARPR